MSMNAVHTCGIVTDSYKKAINKIFEIIGDRTDIKHMSLSSFEIKVVFDTGERWMWIKPTDSARGFRLHEAYIDKNVTIEALVSKINPMMHLYCDNVEWF